METQQYNAEVGTWSRDTNRKVKLEIARLTLKYSGQGQSQQKSTTRNYGGEAKKITFSFKNYMAFVHKGAGKGYGGSKTGTFSRYGKVDKDGVGLKRGTTNVSSRGKMGTGKRVAKPFFNPVIENNFQTLADIIGAYQGDKIISKMQKALIK